MSIMKKVMFAAVGSMVSISAMAADTTLRVVTWLPPTNPQNETVWPTWAKWVEEATEGRVNVVIENHTGHPKTLFDAVEDGVADISFSVNAYLSGRFKLPAVAEIPGEITSAEAGSVALWRTYEEHFTKAGEYDGLHVLGLFVHGPGQLHTKFPVNSLADMKGKKMRMGGGLLKHLAERMEVTPVGAPAPKSYEMLQQGVVDGTFLPAQEQKFFRLTEVTDNLTLFPKGLYTTAFTMMMNPEVFEGLSKKDQDAIMSVSGEKLSQLAGAAWDKADLAGIEVAKASKVNVVMVAEDDARNAELKKLSAGIDQMWVESVSDRGVDAAAALATFRKHAASFAK